MELSAGYWIAALAVMTIKVTTVPVSGPYMMYFTKLQECKETGTHQIQWNGRISHVGNGIHYYNANWTFEIPWDDEIKVKVEVLQEKNGAYTPKFSGHTFYGCKDIWKFCRTMYKVWLATGGYNFTGCPLPAGNYPIINVPNNFTYDTPSYFYGSYKQINDFFKDNKRVGCNIVFFDAVPR